MYTYSRLNDEQRQRILEQKLLDLEAEHYTMQVNIDLADEAEIKSTQLEQAREQLIMLEIQMASLEKLVGEKDSETR